MQKKADIKRILLIGIPMLLLAIGIKTLGSESRLLWFERNSPNSTHASFFLFSGDKERAFKVEENERVTVEWLPEIKKGSLQLSVKKPSSDEIITFRQKQTHSFTAEQNGKVKLLISGQDSRGKFEVRWSITSADS
ncbi:MAG: hypothetical protein K9L66_10810 [Spirochaetaceae bacterium]|nr:hypothetical protein [Spirochaetaceae bacterium]MCF7949542.1 hypothetical protein [Spirochaetia bacterium]MCF7952022.1 hypothetical protein [Spirochaetaceae bacterium]